MINNVHSTEVHRAELEELAARERDDTQAEREVPQELRKPGEHNPGLGFEVDDLDE